MSLNHIWLLCLLPLYLSAGDGGHISLALSNSSDALHDDPVLQEYEKNHNGDTIINMPLVGTKDFAEVFFKFAQDNTGSTISNSTAFRNYLKQLKTNQPEQYGIAVMLLTQHHHASAKKGKIRAMDPDLEKQIQQELMKMALQAMHHDNQSKDETISTQSSALTRNTTTLAGTVAATLTSIAVIVLQSYLASNC